MFNKKPHISRYRLLGKERADSNAAPSVNSWLTIDYRFKVKKPTKKSILRKVVYWTGLHLLVIKSIMYFPYVRCGMFVVF